MFDSFPSLLSSTTTLNNNQQLSTTILATMKREYPSPSYRGHINKPIVASPLMSGLACLPHWLGPGEHRVILLCEFICRAGLAVLLFRSIPITDPYTAPYFDPPVSPSSSSASSRKLYGPSPCRPDSKSFSSIEILRRPSKPRSLSRGRA